MTIAASNEKDVSAIVKKIDPTNRIRFERHTIKARQVVHKVILKEN
jgi:ribosome maturation protein Sdo1